MTAQDLIAQAFPGEDQAVVKARVALLRLMRAVAYAEMYGEAATDWAAMAVSDPALVFSEGDLPEMANALGAVFIAAGHELHRARDAFIELRLEWSRRKDSNSAGAGARDGGNSGREIPPTGEDASSASGDDCPF